jgi:hypothetical protein
MSTIDELKEPATAQGTPTTQAPPSLASNAPTGVLVNPTALPPSITAGADNGRDFITPNGRSTPVLSDTS